MTDTPRTEAELLAIFGPNASGDISSQDMRDLVESIAEPVAGGFGYGTAQSKASQPEDFPVSGIFQSTRIRTGAGVHVEDLYDASGPGLLSEVSEMSSASAYYRFGLTLAPSDNPAISFFYDPEGWLVDTEQEDTDYWGVTHPANTLLALPRGTYLWNAICNLTDGNPGATTELTAYGDYASGPDYPAYYLSGDPVDYAYQGYSSTFFDRTLNDRGEISGYFIVSGDPQLFGPYIRYTNSSNTARKVNLVQFQVTRVN